MAKLSGPLSGAPSRILNSGYSIKEFAGGGPAVAQAVAADRADAGINDEASAKGYMVEYPEFKILDGAPDRGPLSFARRD